VDDQHGQGRRADHVFGDAAEQRAHQSAPTVRPDDDEIGVNLFGHRVDLFPGNAVAQNANHGNAGELSRFDHRIEAPLGGARELGSDIGGGDVRTIGKPVDGDLVGVHQRDRRVEPLGELDRVVQSPIGCLRKINGHQDLLEVQHQRCSCKPAASGGGYFGHRIESRTHEGS
jgi:hypothetical protein